MTMPNERLRAIGWGAELLEALQRDQTVQQELRDEAKRVATTYPSAQLLIGLLASDAREFPTSAGQSIEDTRALFEKVQSTGTGIADTRRHLRFTMRHFPLAGWAEDAGHAARLGRLHDWLTPDLG